MATIGEIAVNVVARTQKFVRGMRESSTAAQRFGKVAASSSTGVAALTASVGMLSRAIATLPERAPMIDELAKTSDKLGIAIGKLQGLRGAANLTGVENRKLEMGLQRLTRRTAEAAQGTGEAVKAFKELGLSASAMAKLAPDELFFRVADRMALVTNRADQIRLAFKLFDSEGVDLVNTLDLGSLRLREISEEFETLGGTLRRSAAADVEKYNDSVTRLTTTIGKLKDQLATELAGPATGAVNLATFVLGGGLAGGGSDPRFIEAEQRARGVLTPDQVQQRDMMAGIRSRINQRAAAMEQEANRSSLRIQRQQLEMARMMRPLRAARRFWDRIGGTQPVFTGFGQLGEQEIGGFPGLFRRLGQGLGTANVPVSQAVGNAASEVFKMIGRHAGTVLGQPPLVGVNRAVEARSREGQELLAASKRNNAPIERTAKNTEEIADTLDSIRQLMLGGQAPQVVSISGGV